MFLYALKWIAVTLLYQGFVHNIAYLFEFQENIALTYQNLSLGIETAWRSIFPFSGPF